MNVIKKIVLIAATLGTLGWITGPGGGTPTPTSPDPTLSTTISQLV